MSGIDSLAFSFEFGVNEVFEDDKYVVCVYD